MWVVTNFKDKAKGKCTKYSNLTQITQVCGSMERNGKKRGDECGRKLEEKRRKNNCHSSKRNQKKNRKFSTEQRKVCVCVCVCVCVVNQNVKPLA